MNDKLKPGTQPFNVENDDVEDWYLPEFNAENSEKHTNALGMKPDWYEGKRKQVDSLVEEIAPVPLTAEELDEIRQAAHEEGYSEGKSQGYLDGLESGKEEGFAVGEEEGKLQGLTQGLEQGQGLITEKAKAWEALQTQMHTPLSEVNSEVENELIRIAMGLAEELIKTELTFNHDVILQTLKLGLDSLPVKEQKITITLNPADLAVITEYYPAEECEKRQWTLIAEPTIKQGDLVINNELSSIELCMEQRIKQMMRRFLVENKPSAV